MLRKVLREITVAGLVAVAGVAFLLGGTSVYAQDDVVLYGEDGAESESVEMEMSDADDEPMVESEITMEDPSSSSDGEYVGAGENVDVDSGEATDRDGSAVGEGTESVEEESEPLMWPVIVSGVAIGVMLLFIIILNIRRK